MNLILQCKHILTVSITLIMLCGVVEALSKPTKTIDYLVQESKQITGIVSDNTGEPIIGAMVVEQGSSNGTITDLDGHFTLKVPVGATLQIQYIGYVNKTIIVTNQKEYNIVLAESIQSADAVIVTALGIKRSEKALGYATQKVRGETLSTVKSVDIATSLTGKIAGLNVRNSSEFNSAPTILLRGEVPLLVVDGVPYGNMSLRDIAADDIETIDILKGATASALYGSRGGAGAIMVTTKRGSKEGVDIQVNSSTMFNAGHLVLPEVQSSYSSGINGRHGGDENTDYVWGDKMDIGRTSVQYDPYTYEWREMELVSKGKNNFKNFLEPGFITNNNISISQKGKYGSFRTSLSHVYNKGQYPNQKLNKITYSINGDIKIDKFSLEAGAIYNKRFYPNNNGTGYYGGNGYMYNLLIWTGADYDVRDYQNYWIKENEEQNWLYSSFYDNPYFLAYEQTSSNDYDKLNTYFSAQYEISHGINLSARTGIDSYVSRSETIAPMSTRAWSYAQNGNGYFATSESSGFSMNSDVLLTGEYKFGDFMIDGFVGGTIYYYYDDYIGSKTQNGLSIPGYYSLKASVDPISSESTYKSKQVNSIYGRFAASWNNAVFVDLTGRNDWSSTLPSETRSYFYPSASTSIVLTELFDTPEWFNFWKIRGSWTMTKNDLSIYEINKAYSIGTNVWDGLNTATYPSTIRSSTLQPTASRSYEVGTAFTLLNHRLRFDIAYYNKLKYNLTRNADISGSTGFTGTLVNYGEEQVRKGVEVTIGASIIQTPDWSWDMNVNWARDRYYYAKIDPEYSTQKPWVAAGERWDWYGIYDWERDPNGNIIHEAGVPVKSDYQSVKGYEYPDWIWGVNNSVRYKNWNLNFSFDGRVGGLLWSNTSQAMWLSGVHPDSDNQWRYDEVVNGKINYVGTGVKVVSGKVEYDTNGGIISDNRVFAPNDQTVSYQAYSQKYNHTISSAAYQHVLDGTFLKLREIAVGYTLPKKISSKMKLKDFSVSIVGQNLLIWMKKFKYSDPDLNSDDLNSPSMRYVGVNFKFNF